MRSRFYRRAARGFTLVEAMIAMSLTAATAVLGISTYVWTIKESRDGTSLTSHINNARHVEQYITRQVQMGRAVSASSDTLEIMYADFRVARLSYVPPNEGTGGGLLHFDPDTREEGGERVLSSAVSQLPGVSMFQTLPSSPQAILVSFHIGDLPPSLASNGQGILRPNYLGVEVRLKASPRNTMGFIQN